MKTISQVIKALRCTSTPNPEDDCPNCPYRELNEVRDDIPLKEDVIIDGKKYWEDCDIDKIAIDAADLLEKIQRNMESDIKFLKRKKRGSGRKREERNRSGAERLLHRKSRRFPHSTCAGRKYTGENQCGRRN